MKKPIALGAYVFAGGFTLGVSEHFEIATHFEGDGAYGVSTFRLNFPHVPVFHGPDRWPAERYRGKVDFIFCNPPCAIFSPLGVSMTRGPNAWRTDPRTNCWRQSFSLLERVQPKVLAIESVPGAYAAKKGRPLMHELAAQANELGYHVTFLFVDGQWLGLPQRRRRFFFIAHRIGLDLKPGNWAPAPTPRELFREFDGDPGVFRPIKGDVIPKLLPQVPPGGSLKRRWRELNPNPNKWKRYPDGRVKGRPMFMQHRIPLDRVAGTFTGNYWYHPTENRLLGIRELCLLNGFPPDYKFAGDSRGWPSLIARGVMPPVGEWISRQVRDALANNQDLDEVLGNHIVDLRRPPHERREKRERPHVGKHQGVPPTVRA